MDGRGGCKNNIFPVSDCMQSSVGADRATLAVDEDEAAYLQHIADGAETERIIDASINIDHSRRAHSLLGRHSQNKAYYRTTELEEPT